MVRFFLFVAAVSVIYIGGFVYEQVGPLLYAVVLTFIASSPLLLKISFWKKIVLMVPLLVLRVVGKVLLSVFGKNALSKVLAKYGLLEKRYDRIVETFAQSKNQGFERWKGMRRSTQAYLLLIFFPVALVIFVLTLIVKFVRLRFLQFVIEKLMQSYLLKWTTKAKSRFAKDESQAPADLITQADKIENRPNDVAAERIVGKTNSKGGSR